jgi:hypothetical protein
MDASNSRATSFTPASLAVAISVRAMPYRHSADCTGTEAGQRSPVTQRMFRTVQPATRHLLSATSVRLTAASAIHHALHVVKRRIGLTVGIGPQRMMGVVRAGVPAPYREVEATDERRARRR